MKLIHNSAKVLLTVIFVLPVLGLLGIFPAPTRDLYNTDAAFAFIQLIMSSAIYIDYMMVAVFAVSAFFLWTKREALAALLIAPITLNIIGFHLFLDGGLLNGGAVPSLVMLAINVYLLYVNRGVISVLLKKNISSAP